MKKSLLKILPILLLVGCATQQPGVEIVNANPIISPHPPEDQTDRAQYQLYRFYNATTLVERARHNKKLRAAEYRLLKDDLELSKKTIDRAHDAAARQDHSVMGFLETAEELIGNVEGYLDMRNLSKLGNVSGREPRKIK